MLVRAEATPGREARSASAAFELRGTGQEGELRLLSPLGTRMATATWRPGQVLLQTPLGQEQFASLEQLSQRALGEPLPLQALPDWLAGRPWPAAPHRWEAAGFSQLGWQVNTAQRREGRVEAQRASAPALLLRVVLDAPA